MNDQLQENFSDGLDELGLAVPFAGEAEAGEALDTESPLSELDQSPFAESPPMAVAGEEEAESESFDAMEPAYAGEDEESSTPEVTTTETLSAAIARTAEQEYHRWHPASGKLRETDSAAVPILQRYYREGVSRSVTAAQLTSKAWQSGHPWSAVFVSWVMRTAGPKSGFAHSSAHQGYIRAARRNRLNGVTSNPFWAYRPTEVAPQVGDLICASRANSGATYDNIAGPQIRPTHCDIVTEVRPGSLRVIGGNVNQNVDAKTIRTLPDGRLALDGAQARFFAVVRSRGPVGAKQAAPPAPTPTPTPRPPVPSSTARRLVVDRHPLLRSHRGTSPDLILRWNRIGASGAIDVVVHFHGFAGQKSGMRLDRDKEPRSGLDFSDPAQPGSAGRDRPTLAILPRGNYYGGRSGYGYDFPNLIGRGALQQLIQDALARLGSATGQTFTMGRLILTGHSGGGAPVMAILAHTDPDEVEVFDGMYGSGANLVRWAERRIARELATPGALPPAMRILYRPGSRQFPGTQPQSEAVARELRRSLGTAAAARLRPFFRVDRTSVEHNDIPGRFGWRLLANPAADLPGVKTFTGAAGTSNEAGERGEESETQESATYGEETQQEAIGASEEQLFEPGETSESYDGANESDEDREALAWLDVEASGMEAEELEPAISESEELDSEALEPGSYESIPGEALEGESEAAAMGEESFEPEAGEEAGEVDRFGEFEDERDAEWESAELEEELEGETSLAASGLTPAERKAVEITSTFETGKRGGFFGLSGNFDGQGLSFGLVNWTIGTGSLQPLLRDFAAEQPQRWASVFGPDAARFLQVMSRKGKEAEREQRRFAVEEMNTSTLVDGKRKWAVREPWVTYFRRLSEDAEFQKIQIRYVRKLLARADYFCRYFKLKSEQSFAFMFDMVSSSGMWWLTKKFGGQEKRRILIEQRMNALVAQHGEGRVPEPATLLAMADVLGATVAPRWAANARERKRWFVTGVHRRAKEVRGLEPRADVPYTISAAGARAVSPPFRGEVGSPGPKTASIVTHPLAQRCGFLDLNGRMRTEGEVRAQVVSAAVSEQDFFWLTRATGALLKEDGDPQFEHLVRYWLEVQSTIPAANMGAIATALGNHAIAPAVKFLRLLRPVGEPPANITADAQTVANNLIAGVPNPATPPNLRALVVEALRQARRSRLGQQPPAPQRRPWSGCFINTCIREAERNLDLEGPTGASEALLGLSANGRHWEYVRDAHRRRFGCLQQNGTFDPACRRNATYHAFAPDHQAVQRGDIIVQDRRDARTQNNVFRVSDSQSNQGDMHGDIVVEISTSGPTSFAETIGGNVGDSARRRRYPLNADGKLVVDRAQNFVQQRDNGTFPGLPSAGPAGANLGGQSTRRIFALLSPVQECIVIPGQKVGPGTYIT